MVMGPASFPVRINRMTGETQVLRLGGWQEEPAPIRQFSLTKEELGNLLTETTIEPGGEFGYGWIVANVYNGTSYTLHEVTVEIKVYDPTKGEIVTDIPYKLTGRYSVECAPKMREPFWAQMDFNVQPWQHWSWSVIGAKGSRAE